MSKTAYPYQKGEMEFGEAFAAYRINNQEKVQMALIMGHFARILSSQDKPYIFGTGHTINWLEPGFSDGRTFLNHAVEIAPYHTSGFRVYGSDVHEEALVKARDLLETQKEVPDVTVSYISVKDAFERAVLTDTKCDVGMFSHMVYHAQIQRNDALLDPVAVRRRMDNVFQNVVDGLHEDGLIIGFHEKRESHLSGTLGEIFGTAMPDAAPQLEGASIRAGFTRFASLDVAPRNIFPEVSAKDLDAFEKVKNWVRYDDPNSPEAIWLKKFLFAIQVGEDKNGLGGGQALEANGTLPQAIRYTRQLLEENNGALIIHARMHAIPKNPARLPLVKAALKEIDDLQPQILDEVQARMQPSIG